MSKAITAAEVNQKMIDGWKEKHSDVFCYKTPDGKVGYLRSPQRSEIEAAQSLKAKPLQSNAVLAKACWLAGDEEILTVDKYFFGLSNTLEKIIKRVEGELTEL